MRLKTEIVLFCVLFCCYTAVHQRMGWNQNSRLDLLHALVVHQTVCIDAHHENTGDKAVHHGRYYSDKAPGIVVLALPAFAAAAALLHALEIPLDSTRGWRAASWIATAGSVGVITALGGVALFAFLGRLVGRRNALLTAYVTFLGAAPFPYATMLFSHGAVIGLIAIALWAVADPLFLARPHPAPAGCSAPESPHWIGRHLLAGLCSGLAIASEYTAAPAAGALLVLTLPTRGRRGLLLAAAAAPALLLVPLYHWACFENPFAFGYHHLALPEFQQMNRGLFGITFPPKPGAAWLILFSPQRGLFFWSPFLLLAFAGFKSALNRHALLALTAATVIALHVLCIAGYYMPGGGSALGPRHLAPVLPFLAILAAFGLRRFPRAGLLAGYLSLVLTAPATLIDAMPADHIRNPLLEFYAPRLERGECAGSLATLLGLPSYAGAILLLLLIIGGYFWQAARFRRP